MSCNRVGNMAAAAGVIGGSDGLWGSFPDVCRVILDQMGLSSWGPLPEPDDGRGSAFPVSLEHPQCSDEVAAPWVVGGGFADAGGRWSWNSSWRASLERKLPLAGKLGGGHHPGGGPPGHEARWGLWPRPMAWSQSQLLATQGRSSTATPWLPYWLPEHKRQIVQMQNVIEEWNSA